MEEKIINNLKNCPRFPACSINKCPLDDEVNLRNELNEEKGCPFTIKKRAKGQKGIRTRMPDHILKFIAESNAKTLNKGNLKRWHSLYKKDGNKQSRKI